MDTAVEGGEEAGEEEVGGTEMGAERDGTEEEVVEEEEGVREDPAPTLTRTEEVDNGTVLLHT